MRTILAALLCVTIASPAIARDKTFCAQSEKAWQQWWGPAVDYSRTNAANNGVTYMILPSGRRLTVKLGWHDMDGVQRYCAAIYEDVR